MGDGDGEGGDTVIGATLWKCEMEGRSMSCTLCQILSADKIKGEGMCVCVCVRGNFTCWKEA
jgi:DUF917 family protein